MAVWLGDCRLCLLHLETTSHRTVRVGGPGLRGLLPPLSQPERKRSPSFSVSLTHITHILPVYNAHSRSRCSLPFLPWAPPVPEASSGGRRDPAVTDADPAAGHAPRLALNARVAGHPGPSGGSASGLCPAAVGGMNEPRKLRRDETDLGRWKRAVN